MIRTAAVIMIALLHVFVSGTMAYQGSLTGSGARAMGMGGAFIAVADDATAISWNPAGLTRLDEPEAGIAVTFGSGGWDVNLSSDYFLDFEFDMEEETKLSLNFASGVVPFKLGERHAVAAIGYRRYWDQTQKTTQTFTYFEDIWAGDFYYDQVSTKQDVTGAVIGITPAIAVQLSPMISLGATASIMTGNYESIVTDEYSWFGEDQYSAESEQTSKYSGFTAEFGALVDVSPKVRFGAVASLPWTLKIKDGELDGQPLDDVEQKLPAFFGAGIAVKPTPMLTLALDARHHPWSKVELNDVELEWSDATVLRGGLEYILVGETAIFPLRAGYYIEPLAEEDADEDQVKTTAFTVGGGFILGRFTVDICYVRATTPFAGSVAGVPADFDLTENLFTLSGVIHFGPGEEE